MSGSERPLKAEIASAAKLLREMAARERNWAEGRRKLASQARTEVLAAHNLKAAGQCDSRADRWERVAAWMVAP